MKPWKHLKKQLSFCLATILLLSCTAFVHAEEPNGTSSPTAANLQGHSVLIDGVRDAAEGWTDEPTLIINSAQNVNALKMWLGTDGTWLYCYMEIRHENSGGRRLMEAEFDFINSHDEKNTDGTAKYTKDSYRQMLGKESLIGEKSAWLQLDVKDNACYAARQYRAAGNEDGTVENPTNSGSYLSQQKENWKTTSSEVATVEFRIVMPEYVRTALKNGTYTIGVGGAYCWGWDHTQHDTAVHGTFPSKKDGKAMDTIEPALLKDIILPQTDGVLRAANVKGKTMTLDGIRSADEGWTIAPTVIATENLGLAPVQTWLATDGDWLYVYTETKYSTFRFLQIQIDFLNADAETDAEGNPKWTPDSYLSTLAKEVSVGEKSMWIRHEKSVNYPYGRFQFFGSDNHPDASSTGNEYSEKTIAARGFKKDETADLLAVEYKIPLPSYIKTALKTGTYTIGFDGAGATDWNEPKQHSGTIGSFLKKDGTEQKLMHPALLPDVILPCTNAQVGQLLGTQTADMGETFGIRFLATTDNKNLYTAYQSVGFDFTLDGKVKKVEKECEFLYDSVTANYGAETVAAKDYGANYIYACTIEGLAKAGTYTFTVTPWTLEKGEDAVKTYGTSYTVTYTDGAFVSATPTAAN